jgi:hypothetical protein
MWFFHTLPWWLRSRLSANPPPTRHYPPFPLSRIFTACRRRMTLQHVPHEWSLYSSVLAGEFLHRDRAAGEAFPLGSVPKAERVQRIRRVKGERSNCDDVDASNPAKHVHQELLGLLQQFPSTVRAHRSRVLWCRVILCLAPGTKAFAIAPRRLVLRRHPLLTSIRPPANPVQAAFSGRMT